MIFQNEIVVDRSCVHQLISNIINAPRLTPERYVVVKKLWGAVLTLADDFAETAVQGIILQPYSSHAIP